MDLFTYTYKYIKECPLCKSSEKQFRIMGKRQNKSHGRFPKKNVAITTTVIRCKHCGLIFSSPLPIPAIFDMHYNVPPDNYWTEGYLERANAGSKNLINFLKDKINMQAGDKVLDVGSGLGFTIKRLMDTGYDAYGVEPSSIFVNFAIEKNQIPNTRIYTSVFEEALINSKFNLILFQAVFEHLPNPFQSLEKALNLLVPGGKIFIEVPNAKWLIGRLYNLYYKLSGTDYVTNLSPMHIPYHLYEYSLKTFQKSALAEKYNIFFYQYWNCYDSKYLLKRFIVNKLMKWSNSGMELVLILEKTDGK